MAFSTRGDGLIKSTGSRVGGSQRASVRPGLLVVVDFAILGAPGRNDGSQPTDRDRHSILTAQPYAKLPGQIPLFMHPTAQF